MRRAEEHVMDCANKEINCSKYEPLYNCVLEFDEDLHIECHKRRGIDTVVSSNLASTNYNFE